MSEEITIRYDNSEERIQEQIELVCDALERVYDSGDYPKLAVRRNWSNHNPEIFGEVAKPRVFRSYLRRELFRLVLKGAELTVAKSRPRVDINDPKLLEFLDESEWDLRQKKLFLFGPERCELSIQRLEHYTGTRAEDFQRYILLTNYRMHMTAFEAAFPKCKKPSGEVQMPAYHSVEEDKTGISIVNIGVGPSNAKNCTDHIAVLRPDAMIMVGHCAGIRNHQEIGHFVLASGYMRADHVLDKHLPASVPVTPSSLLNQYLASVLDEQKIPYRTGTVYTTADRNWELALAKTTEDLQVSRSLAIDMESATVATNGFRYRIPNATLLCVSDKPLHGKPKLPGEAQEFYRETQRKHISIAVETLSRAKTDWPGGLPNSSLRAPNEPLLGGSD